MDDPLIAAFGFRRASPGMRRLVHLGLKLHTTTPLAPLGGIRTAGPRWRKRSYPHGYRIEGLGPHEPQ